MNTHDELHQQLNAFHLHMAALYRVQHQEVARRYLASIQPESTTMQPVTWRTHRLFMWGRRLLSRQLYTLAQAVEPKTPYPKASSDTESTYHVVDTSDTRGNIAIQEKHHDEKVRIQG